MKDRTDSLSTSYVNEELIHFVGRALPDDEARYSVLMQILQSGLLAPRGVKKDVMTVVLEGSLPATEAIMTECLCFCDIPLHSLRIHISKYSKFGLAFPKTFLMNKGVNPVFYYQVDQLETGEGLRLNRGENLRCIIGGASQIYQKYKDDTTRYRIRGSQGNGSFEFDFEVWYKLLLFEILGFVKPFTLADEAEHPDNFYMEREWRSMMYINFETTDLSTIFIPREFSERFYRDKPESFRGQIILL